MNPITASRRHFEDLVLGEKVELGAVTVTRAMIIAFAREFDPLPFHLDEDAARKSLLGGLASSGWQTAALTLRLLTDSFFSQLAAAGGLGVSDLKWLKPVMKGDTISARAEIVELRRSRSHPQWGVMTVALEVRNQKQQLVMTMRFANLVETRLPEPATMSTGEMPYDTDHRHGTP